MGTELVNEIAHVVEREGRRERQKSPDLALKPAPFVGSGIRPEGAQCGAGGTGLGEHVFVQISTEDPAEFRKG